MSRKLLGWLFFIIIVLLTNIPQLADHQTSSMWLQTIALMIAATFLVDWR